MPICTAWKRDVGTRFQVTLDLSRPAKIEWIADGGPNTSTHVTPGRPEVVGAVRSLQIQIEDLGRIQVNCGATELAKLLDDIATKTSALDAAISGFGTATCDLPQGFDKLEESRISGEGAAHEIKDANERMHEAERELGSLADLRQDFATSQQQVTAAEVNFTAVQSLVPEGLDATGLDAEVDSLKEQLATSNGHRNETQREFENANSALTAPQTALARCEEISSQCKFPAAGLNRRLNDLLANSPTGGRRSADVICHLPRRRAADTSGPAARAGIVSDMRGHVSRRDLDHHGSTHFCAVAAASRMQYRF
jgi:hypothetical protein